MEARGNKASSTDGYWIVKKGDIVVNKLLAWMGSVGLSEYDGVTSPAYDVLRKTSKRVDVRYFSYLFRTEIAKQIFKRNSRGIMDMRLRLYFDKLGAITVPVPPFSTQQAIATYIDTKTEKIDRQMDLLGQKATHYGKLKQSLIDETVMSGLDKSVPMKESHVEWFGAVPKHWELKRLKELASIQNSNVDKKSHDEETAVRLCNYVDVYKNEFITGQLSQDFMWATADESEIKKFGIRKNDLLITKDSETADDIAIPALATETLDGVLCGYPFCLMQPTRTQHAERKFGQRTDFERRELSLTLTTGQNLDSEQIRLFQTRRSNSSTWLQRHLPWQPPLQETLHPLLKAGLRLQWGKCRQRWTRLHHGGGARAG